MDNRKWKWEEMNRYRWIGIVAAAMIVLVATLLILRLDTDERPSESPWVNWRWVGIKMNPDDDCPPLEGWHVQPLFAPGPDTPASALPRELRAFCVYENRVRVVNDDEVPLRPLIEAGDLSGMARDAKAVIVASDDLPKAMWPILREHFHSQVGRTQLPPEGPRNVRLALLDTAPTGGHPHLSPPAAGKSWHGYTLANLAHDLLCSDTENGDTENCLARLTSRLALPLVQFDPKNHVNSRRDEGGGYFGTLTDLARAIHEEVTAWKEDTKHHERLILNLSLGWDPGQLGDPERKRMDAAVSAVYEAIRNAVSEGALVVAAAGNVLGGPEDRGGPLLPAGWETHRAPGCPPRYVEETFPYRPLVYAAGAVGCSSERLANARPGGLPRLVAYGDHAVTECNHSRGYTATLTGSSVSALVVSATAAAVWSYDPYLMPHEVMELVYHYAHPNDQPAEFYLEDGKHQSPPRMHRVSLCSVLQDACTARGDCPRSFQSLFCGELLGDKCSPYFSEEDFRNFYKNPPTPTETTSIGWKMVDPAPQNCAPGYRYFHDGNGNPSPGRPEPSPPTSFCPFQELPGFMTQVPVRPQPEADPCPSCALLLDNEPPPPDGAASSESQPPRLFIEISEGFDGTLTDPTLVVGERCYSLPVNLTVPGKRKAVIIDPFGGADAPPLQPGDQVALQFTVDGSSSVLSPVLVAEKLPSYQ